MNWGADLRIRNEYFNNALSLTSDPQLSPLFAHYHSQDYFRIRGRVWTSPHADRGSELKHAGGGRTPGVHGALDHGHLLRQVGHAVAVWHLRQPQCAMEAAVEPAGHLYRRPPGHLPGRRLAGGDGTPEDGSFTFFLDSARFTYNLEDQKTTIDTIGIIQYARPDAWLPTIGPSTTQGANPEPFLLTDQNEKGAILWIANKSIPQANLDGYFIYKHDTRINDFPEATFGDNGDIYTLGGRVSGLVEDHWKYSVEGAYQFGRKQDPELNGQSALGAGVNPLLADSAQTAGFRDLSAFGINSKLSYLFKDEWKDQLNLLR